MLRTILELTRHMRPRSLWTLIRRQQADNPAVKIEQKAYEYGCWLAQDNQTSSGGGWLRKFAVAVAFFIPVVASNAQTQIPPISVTASDTYAGYPPENAIDGTSSTIWSAGVFGESSPWIELDLGASNTRTATQIRLLVSQSPGGATTHVITGTTSGGAPVSLGTIVGDTSDNQWLEMSFSPSVLRVIRVTTTQSPSWVSWREIQVSGPGSPMGTLTSSPPTCEIVPGESVCSSSLSWSTQNAGVSRVWIRSGPSGAGQWVTEGVSGTEPIPWITEGVYTFDLRQGTDVSGDVLASATITGVAQMNTWIANWIARPCVVDVSTGETNIQADAYGSLVDCPNAAVKEFWIAPSALGPLYKNCTTLPSSLNCTAVNGSSLLYRGGNETSTYSYSQEGNQLISVQNFDRAKTIDSSIQLRPTCINVDMNTFDGCYIGLTLSNGEDDYRAIGLFYTRDGWLVKRLLNRVGFENLGFINASGTLSPPNHPEPSVVSPTVTLRMRYVGITGQTSYFLNGVQVFDHSDGTFGADPHIALVAASTGTLGPNAGHQYVEVLADALTVTWQ